MAANENQQFQIAFQRCVELLTQDAERALSQLFDLSAERLVRLAMAVTGNQADAEDALQGAFSRVAAKPRLLAHAEAPWPYLIRIVRNESLRLLQKRKKTGSETVDLPAAADDSPEAVLVYEETTAAVRRILRSLPAAQYEVVVLKHWEDLTFAEIADVLNLSQNTVASRYRYAMEKLQRSLEPLVK